MANIPHTSVVIPCFNAERYIAATLRSVLNQSGAKLDVIVVDDGSTDGSAVLVEREFPQVRLVRRNNAGVASARNAGIANARCEWIAFCDADDIWLAGKLDAQFTAIASIPECRMSCTAWHVWPSTTPEPEPGLLQQLAVRSHDPCWHGPSGWLYPDLLLDCEVWTSTVLAHCSVFTDVGVFDTDLRIGEDYDLWLRASRVTRIERVPKPLALYRQHPRSITRSAPTDNYKVRVVQRAIDRWGYAGPDGREADRSAIKRMLAKSHCDFAAAQIAVGRRDAARASLYQAFQQDPTHLAVWKLWVRSLLPLGSTP